jgi:hypothetical protein
MNEKEYEALLDQYEQVLDAAYQQAVAPTQATKEEADGPDGFGHFRFREWTFDLTPSEQAIITALWRAGVGTRVSVLDLDACLGAGSGTDNRRTEEGRTPAERVEQALTRVDKHKKNLARELAKRSGGAVSISMKRNDDGVPHYWLVVETAATGGHVEGPN